MTIETYTLTTPSGRRIRQATRVRFVDGRTISFLDKLLRGDALRQACELAERNQFDR